MATVAVLAFVPRNGVRRTESEVAGSWFETRTFGIVEWGCNSASPGRETKYRVDLGNCVDPTDLSRRVQRSMEVKPSRTAYLVSSAVPCRPSLFLRFRR